MSGPVTPPLEVSDVADGGSVTGRPITTIEVTDGTLSVSGRTATITTGGGGGSGTVTSITAAADSGTGTAITTSGTFTFTGGTGVTTSVSGTTVTIVADNNGDVTATGTPVDNQLAIWDSATSIEGDANLTWDGSTLTVTGALDIDNIKVDGNTISSTDTNGAIDLSPNGAGVVTMYNAYRFPTAVTTTNDYVLTAQTDGTTAWAEVSGGGSPAGSTTEVQFNDAGSFGASASFTYNDTTKVLTIGSGTATPTVQSGSVDLILRNSSAAAHSKITLGYDSANSNIVLDTDGTGLVEIHKEGALAYSLPNVVTGTNDYVLTAQTDGTTAWAEAGGGGGISSVLPLVGSTGATQYNVGTAMPWGNSSTGTQTINPLDKPFAFPFIAPETGTVNEIGVRVTTGDAGRSLYVGIYSQDSNNLPSTLLGYATIPLDSTGNIYDNSLSANPSLTAGTQYWYTVNGDAAMYNGVLQSNTLAYLPDLGVSAGLNDQIYSIQDDSVTAYDPPPASFTADTLDKVITRPYVGLKYA